MVQIRYVEFDGTEHEVDVPAGMSLMRGALENGIDGIAADCGGDCSCATCHVYIEEPWRSMIPAPTRPENEMLDCTRNRRETSRLSCQVVARPGLDGLVAKLPRTQY